MAMQVIPTEQFSRVGCRPVFLDFPRPSTTGRVRVRNALVSATYGPLSANVEMIRGPFSLLIDRQKLLRC